VRTPSTYRSTARVISAFSDPIAAIAAPVG
jgi:hypothetical protein